MALISHAQVAREAGLNPLMCPHCEKSCGTSKVIRAFFRSILKHILEGDEVHIAGFGTFVGRKIKGRKLVTPIMEGGEVTFGDRVTLRFRQTRAAKAFLNGAEPQVEADGPGEEE